MRLLILPILLASMSVAAVASNINVPGDYDTINEAITAASNGDNVLVAAGVYDENIDFLGKAITVRGKQGPYKTTIQGLGLGSSVVSFINNEGSDSVLEGFRIINGNGTFYTLSRGIVGGGVFCKGSTPIMKDLIIASNEADNGAGVYCIDGTVEMDNVIIEDNTAALAGGGLFLNNATGQLTGCRVTNNKTLIADGGGIYGVNATIDVADSQIIGNQSAFWGGGVANIFGLSTTLKNTVVAQNTADITGGGIGLFYGGSLSLVNVTLYENAANQGLGGGLFLNFIDPASVENTILWGNTAPTGPSAGLESSILDLDYCDVEGGVASISVTSGTLNYGGNNISQQPSFTNVPANDYHLLSGSGGIDAGNNNAAGLPAFDFEGDDRINDGVVDMGADEHMNPYFYFTGVVLAGETLNLNIIGEPLAFPVYMFMSTGVLPQPIPLSYGDWLLKFPVIRTIPLPPVPVTGYIMYPGTVPATGLPHGTPFAWQALIGDTLTPVQWMVVE